MATDLLHAVARTIAWLEGRQPSRVEATSAIAVALNAEVARHHVPRHRRSAGKNRVDSQSGQHVHMAHAPTQVEVSEKLEQAITMMPAIAPLSASAKLSVLRRVGESVAVSPDDIDAAFERVKLRSAGVEGEVRNKDGGGLSESEFAAKLGVASRQTVRRYRKEGRLFAWKTDARNLGYPR